jgi:hypothetical protein
MSSNHYFKPKMPKGYRIFYGNFNVALAKEYVSQIEELVGAKDVKFELEPHPKNKYDPNAILVTAAKKGLLWTSNLILGYLPKEIAKEVTEKELAKSLIPRPKEIWTGDRGGFSFVIDLVGPKPLYKEFEAAKQSELEQKAAEEASRPATTLQKEYYKFFGIKLAKGTTSGQAEEFIQKHRDLMTRANDERLEYWDSFVNLWEELSDPEVREDLDIKKPSLSLARKAFEEWRKEDNFCKDDIDDILEFADKLLELKPDLQRNA